MLTTLCNSHYMVWQVLSGGFSIRLIDENPKKFLDSQAKLILGSIMYTALTIHKGAEIVFFAKFRAFKFNTDVWVT